MTVGELPVAELARRCREETLRFLRGEARDDAFCFEIFQRAVVQRSDDAWEAIVAQYRSIVMAYVAQHTAAAIVHEPDDYWVNRAFQRFWAAVGPDRFSKFPDLPSVLKYVKLCVHSVLMDELRSRRVATIASLDEVPETRPAQTDSEARVIGELASEELWATISRDLQGEAERQVVYLSFVRDLKPAEIFERHSALFSSVADVYRIKRNVIERLRRNAEIRAFLPT
jgi:hypothetical protein